MKRVRFEEPEEFLADCSVVFDHVLSRCFEEKQDTVKLERNSFKERILRTICKDDVDSFIDYMCSCPEIFDDDFFDGYSALHVAVKNDAFGITEHILLSGIIDIDVRSADFDATTPLFWAIKENRCRMVEMLLTFGAADTLLSVYGDTAVFTAVYYRQVSILKILVDRGCDCNYERNEIEHVLSSAIQCKGTGEATQELINILASRASENDIQLLKTCLQQAVRYQNTDMTRRMLPHMNDDGVKELALSTALYSYNIHLVKLLLSPGTKLTKDHFNSVARRCEMNLLQYLLNNHPLHPESKISSIYELIKNSTYDRHYQLTSMAPRNRAYPTWPWSDVREEISQKHSTFLKVMQLLLDHGAYANSRDITVGFSSTALHVSLDTGLVCISLFLLMAGADPTVADKNGNTPFYTIVQQLLQIDQMHWKKKQNLCRLLHGLDIITRSHSKEATKINALLTRPDHSATLDKLPEHVVCLLTSIHSQPKQLMNICRMCIVKSLAPNSHAKVSKLQLPTVIQKYLLFRDLDEMLLDMAGRKRKSNNNSVEHTVPTSEEYSKLSDSSESETDEDKDYEVPVEESKKKKNRGQSMKSQIQPKPEPMPRKKLCLCTI